MATVTIRDYSINTDVAYVTINTPISMTVSESFTLTLPSYNIRGHLSNLPSSGSRYYSVEPNLYNNGSYYGSFARKNSNTVSSDSTNATISATTYSASIAPNLLFSSSNKTQRTSTALTVRVPIVSFEAGIGSVVPSAPVTIATYSITLDAPPTFKVVDSGNVETNSVWYDTPYVYAGLTTASIKVSNLSAKYGGDISDATLTIGSQSVSRSDNGVLSILLANVGTFTPTVTVTDSRGQTTTKTLDEITVQGYVAPAVSFSVERTLPKTGEPTPIGKPDDEGESATITATFAFTDAIATLSAPTIAVTDEDGNAQAVTTTWYSSRASDGTLSGSVTWASLSSGATVYGLVTITGDFNTQKSYQVALTPQDSIGAGTTITQTLGSAFYTVDFLAGGHGIAFGQPASQNGFFCNMDAHFVDKADVMRALFDFIHPVGSYYETSDTAFDPNVTWGGTWVLETEGLVHISAGANYTISGALTDTKDGGEETHKLETTEIPAHTHGQKTLTGTWECVNLNSVTASGIMSKSAYSSSSYTGFSSNSRAGSRVTLTATHTHDSVGGGGAHNNMQPYIVVNRWHRTA